MQALCNVNTMQCFSGQLCNAITASTMTMQYACCLQATMHHNCFQFDTYSLEMHVLYNLEKITKITHMYVV